MKKCLFLMVFFGLSGNVFADVAKEYKKMIEAGEEWQKENDAKYQGDMQEKMDEQSRMYNKYEKQRKNYEEEMKSLRESNTKLALEIQELTNSVAAIEQDSNKSVEAYTRFTKENRKNGLTDHGFLGIGQSKENEEWKRLRSRMESDIDKLDRLNKKLADAKKDLEKQVSLIADSHARLGDAANLSQAYKDGYFYDKSLKDSGKAGESARMAAAVYAAAVNGSYKIYTDMQKDHYDAQLLLTDFATMESKHQITGIKLELLKQRNFQFLQNTLIGDFVKQSIKAERESKEFCESVNKCAGGSETAAKISDLERRIGEVTGVVEGHTEDKAKEKDSKKKTDKK